MLGKICSILGYALGIPIMLTTILGISMLLKGNSEEGLFAATLFFLVIDLACVVLIIIGLRIKRRIRRFKEYVHLISQEQITSLREIADATGRTFSFVESDLQSMIRHKFFPSARIDEITEEIIITRSLNGIDITGLDMETVFCMGCGAPVVKRRHSAAQCEYCGSTNV